MCMGVLLDKDRQTDICEVKHYCYAYKGEMCDIILLLIVNEIDNNNANNDN